MDWDDWLKQPIEQQDEKEQDPIDVQYFVFLSLGNPLLPDEFDCKDAHLTTIKKLAETCRYTRLLRDALSKFSHRWSKFDDSDVLVRWSHREGARDRDALIAIEVDFKAIKFGVQPTLKLEMFAEPGVRAPWPNLESRRPVAEAVTAESAAQITRIWLGDCLQNHPTCQLSPASSPLPTRVINVRGPSLFITNSIEARYAALSHCWGDPKVCQMLTTTKASLEERQKSIPWDRLSKTFRDAILITQNLGLDYLWIDSLCIVQDDADDWAVESAKMALVYSNAHLVLAATAGSDGNHGCLFPRGPTHHIPFNAAQKATVTNEDNTQASVLVREVIEHTELVAAHKSPLSAIPYPRNFESPLLSRAWCYQEQLLATRMLHFHASELRWECRTLRACECGSLGSEGDKHKDTYNRRWTLPAAAEREDVGILLARWADQVARYSIRSLTYETDRLAALAGVASNFECPQLGRYVAGVWENYLLEGLQWERPSRLELEFEQSRRPKAYRAPSWSWAALEGDVGFRNTLNTKFEAKAQVEKVEFELDSPLNPYGSVKWARLVVKGTVVLAQLLVEEYETNCCSLLYLNGAKDMLKFRTDIPAAPWLPQQTEEPEVGNDTKLSCLYLGVRSSNKDDWHEEVRHHAFHVFLVLRAVKGSGGEFHRVGIIHVEAEKMGQFDEAKQETLVLV